MAHYLVLSQQAGAQPAADGADAQAAAPTAEAELASGADAAPAADDTAAAAPMEAAGVLSCTNHCCVTKEAALCMGQLACVSEMTPRLLMNLKAFMCNATHWLIHAEDDASGAAGQEQATTKGVADDTAIVKAAEGTLPCKP